MVGQKYPTVLQLNKASPSDTETPFLDLNFSMVYISQLIRFARACSNDDDFNNRNLFLTVNLLKQGYRYQKIRKAFSKFYQRHSEIIVKYNNG